MSSYLTGKVWFSDLDAELKPLAATLADLADDDGSNIEQPIAYLAWRLGRSERSVQANISRLRETGILLLSNSSSSRKKCKYNRYRLIEANLPKRPIFNNLENEEEENLSDSNDEMLLPNQRIMQQNSPIPSGNGETVSPVLSSTQVKNQQDTGVLPSSMGETVAPVPISKHSDNKNMPMYDFGTFRSLYPDHRMWKHERQAKDQWNALRLAEEEKVALIDHLALMIKSDKWKEKSGQYVPNPEKYLSERYWEHPLPEYNHREECERLWKIFISVTGHNGSLHSLTDSRYKMLSRRWDDAIQKADGHSPENAFEIIAAAMEAAKESHDNKKVPKRLTLESILETTETMERWIAAAMEQE